MLDQAKGEKMSRLIRLTLVGVAVTALVLVTAGESRADHRNRSSFSVGVGSGGFQFDYSRGYPGYYPRTFVPRYGAYYPPVVPGGYILPPPVYAPRPVIVQPTEYHWTPGRGWHTHGDILIPHRGHYHVRPY